MVKDKHWFHIRLEGRIKSCTGAKKRRLSVMIGSENFPPEILSGMLTAIHQTLMKLTDPYNVALWIAGATIFCVFVNWAL